MATGAPNSSVPAAVRKAAHRTDPHPSGAKRAHKRRFARACSVAGRRAIETSWRAADTGVYPARLYNRI